MKNFLTWLLVMFMLMFWAFRVVVAVAAQLNWEFPFQPLNLEVEIFLLFFVLLCVVLIIKRKVVGGLLYFLAYGLYFGVDVWKNFSEMFTADVVPTLSIYTNLFMSVLGMILAIVVLLDLLMDKGRKAHLKDEKTDWFYTNKQFDRKKDERADTNNYRIL